MTSETGFRILSSFSITQIWLFSIFEMYRKICLEIAWSKCHLLPQKSRFISKHVPFDFSRKALIRRKFLRQIRAKGLNFVFRYSPSQETRFFGFLNSYFPEKWPQKCSIRSNWVVQELKMFVRISSSKLAKECFKSTALKCFMIFRNEHFIFSGKRS